jgi:ABC-type sugar transport system ATPase subunit
MLKSRIYKLLHDLADAGAAILIVSFDMESDRCRPYLVMAITGASFEKER